MDFEKIAELAIQYIKPELLIVAIALYMIGMALKKTTLLKDEYIPLVLGGVGIVVAAIYVFATSPITTAQEVAMAIFVSLTQGVLCAGISVYVNQLIKQTKKGVTAAKG